MSDNDKVTRQIRRFLSLVLRHQPGRIGTQLNDAGGTRIDGRVPE